MPKYIPTHNDIEALQIEAGAAGDYKTVTDCEKALYSNKGRAALKRITKIIANNRSQ